MKQLMNKLQSIYNQLIAHIPTKLPKGITEFDEWAKSIIKTYEMPDNDSIRFALAVSIMHLPATAARKAKAYFGAVLHKGAASQVAGQVMQDLKAKQASEAAKSVQQPIEATTTTTAVASNVSTQATKN